ncbi:hypothetical protein ACFQER_07860 [Halomicroarcula sp. GCM10025894]|uniref:hypothetical protein n=1 Tax=Halomicroarcula sp. GCM10025894 TaxID=3252673 RepID=UPI0036098F18
MTTGLGGVVVLSDRFTFCSDGNRPIDQFYRLSRPNASGLDPEAVHEQAGYERWGDVLETDR